MANKIEKTLQASLNNCGAIIGKNAELSFFYVGELADVVPFFILMVDKKPGYLFGRGYIGVSIVESDGFLNKNSSLENTPIIFTHSTNLTGNEINKPIPIENNAAIVEGWAREVVRVLNAMPRSTEDLRNAINEMSILKNSILKFIDPYSRNAMGRYENFLKWCNVNNISVAHMPSCVDGFVVL